MTKISREKIQEEQVHYFSEILIALVTGVIILMSVLSSQARLGTKVGTAAGFLISLIAAFPATWECLKWQTDYELWIQHRKLVRWLILVVAGSTPAALLIIWSTQYIPEPWASRIFWLFN